MLGAACNGGRDDESKPSFDPSEGIVDTGKSDFASNDLTTIVGTLAVGGVVEAAIGYPDWLHGYTIDLDAGVTVDVRVASDVRNVAATYGPAVRFAGGRPRFRRPIEIVYRDDGDGKTLTIAAEEAGTYMVVFGPLGTWRAGYRIAIDCVDGCDGPQRCDADDQCDVGEFCGDNGVRCIRAPCDANFDVCQPRVDEGGSCWRDAMCADTLACIDDTCRPAPADVCDGQDLWSDCGDGFCGCADGTCDRKICRPYRDEGDSCGGFTPVEHAMICRPELTCFGSTVIADAPGHCVIEATVAELLDDPARFAGHFVGVIGHVENGVAICTQMACGRENQCCNRCGASQRLVDEPTAGGLANNGIELANDGELYRCGGDNCSVYDHCTVDEGGYRVSGTFVYEPERPYAARISVRRIEPTQSPF